MPRPIQESNAGKSVIRSRVERVFAHQKSQTGLFVRTVGITRATVRIGLANIVYNMRRFLFLERTSGGGAALDLLKTQIKNDPKVVNQIANSLK